MSENVFVSQPLPAGTILDNKFEIVCSLGQGGFGITYLGHNTVLDIPVAIKEYFPKDHASRKGTQVTIEDSAYFDEWKKKFRAEARALAKFANLPGIVNVYDFCEENGTAYIIMEYLDGITLSKYVEKNGPMEASSFLKRLIPVLTSLEKIHQQGLIHRDISPDNLMLMDDGFLKLYDFGAAREYSDATKPNFSVIIKRNFAPEEQYRSKGVQGPWTDVYSICATIYFSITGVVPDDSPQRVFSDELKKPSELGIYLPSKIEKTILKGMSVKSGDRFNSVRPLISAFEEADSANIKSGFGKGKKTKSTKAQNIFSLFHTSSKRRSVTSAPPSTSSSANKKTEIVLTQYGSG
ncbi:MAG: serine/threonine protein kinase, partial [Oscillospiraceae bacterium]|nr:serine/threonine protein kinase [Oscillospiraceae bacterium]